MGFSRGGDAAVAREGPLRRPASEAERARAVCRPGKRRPSARAAESRRPLANVPIACPHAATARVVTAHNSFMASSSRAQRQSSPSGAWRTVPARDRRLGAKANSDRGEPETRRAPDQCAATPRSVGKPHAEIGVDDRRGSGRGNVQMVQFTRGRSYQSGLPRGPRKAGSKDLASGQSGGIASKSRQMGLQSRCGAGGDVGSRVESAHHCGLSARPPRGALDVDHRGRPDFRNKTRTTGH